jgi:DNA-binding response OmpR family regulator
MSLPRILVIDDEPANLELIREALAPRYDVEVEAQASIGVRSALKRPPELLIVDLEMPGMDGIEVCEALRGSHRTANIAIIILTSDTQAASMQRALRAGADDYVTKPFRVPDLLHRIEFRLGQARVDEPLRCGNLVIEPAASRAYVRVRSRRESVKLTPLGFKLLEAFVRNEDRVLTREQLLDQVWGNAEASDRAVDLHVFRLRRLLASWDHSIEAVYGKGYAVTRKSKGGS